MMVGMRLSAELAAAADRLRINHMILSPSSAYDLQSWRWLGIVRIVGRSVTAASRKSLQRVVSIQRIANTCTTTLPSEQTDCL